MKTYAILLASGTGERTKSSLPKQFLKISGKTVLEHSIECFESCELVDEIIIVVSKQFIQFAEEICESNGYRKITKILTGGKTRQESSSIGVGSLEDGEAKILIHDAVRPLLGERIIRDCISALDKYDAVDVAIATADTIVKVDESMNIEEIPRRQSLMRGQTPQAFKLSVIRRAHELAKEHVDLHITDDCGLVKAFNLSKIHIINGDETNVKITYPIDIFIADKLYQIKNLLASDSNLENLRGKTLIIFGASGGIGNSICQLAEKHGTKVYNFSRANATDVRKRFAIDKALKFVHGEEGRIDFVINATGILRLGELCCRTEEDIREEIETNYFGCINVALGAHEFLRHSKGALLFFTSSSYTRGRALYSIYSSTKAAVVNLTQALADEWSRDGIRVNVINPARTATSLRFANFGKEDPETLLAPEFVAEKTLTTLLQSYTGQVVDVKKYL
ncbi:MAG: 2-C-methyl-D-erythritol 4-phosphate cytidylyltransferase [Puniceicoccales bacterium]|jgi:2-C-methyl-D-erythritol 4-phosphate cytidylyltransferase|nr:2-C-methyl-D-erythritol 4-phosphate cytidylyltransferase [Puniceicoccales bacterium]